MFTKWRPAAAFLALAILASGLTGCGNEPQQRQAFIEFLQRRIVNRPGLHIPIMSETDVKSFGPYADQYRIMSSFHHQVDATVEQDLARAMQIGTPTSLDQLANKRALFPLVRQSMAKFKTETEAALAKADAAHAALKQPPDLKAVYDAAYDKMVTKPAAVFSEIAPLIDGALRPLEELANYLDQNRSVIDYRDGVPTSKDTLVNGRLVSLIDATAVSAKASVEGKRKLRAMIEGH